MKLAVISCTLLHAYASSAAAEAAPSQSFCTLFCDYSHEDAIKFGCFCLDYTELVDNKKVLRGAYPSEEDDDIEALRECVDGCGWEYYYDDDYESLLVCFEDCYGLNDDVALLSE